MLKRLLIIFLPLVLILLLISAIFYLRTQQKSQNITQQSQDANATYPEDHIGFSDVGKFDNKKDVLYLVGKLKSTTEKLGSVYGNFEIATNPTKNQEFLLLQPSTNTLLVEFYKTDNINEPSSNELKSTNLKNPAEARKYLNENIETNFLIKIVSPYPDAEENTINYLKCNQKLNEQIINEDLQNLNCIPFVWTLGKYEKNQ